MRLDTSQQMRLGQQMRLAPRMIQSMEILQMPLAELEERIEKELESNVALEIVEPGGEEESQSDEGSGAAPAAGTRPERVPPDRAPSRELEPGSRSRAAGERDGKMDAMAAAPARQASLVEQLLSQWALCDVRADLRPLGELLIAHVESDGYLRTPLEAIARERVAREGEASVTPERLAEALTAVQMLLEPAGVAARDAWECLLLQMDAKLDEAPGDASLRAARRIVAEHLDDLAHNRVPRIAAETGLTLEEVKAGIEQVRRLSLAPARRLVDEPAQPIVPDAIVEYDEEQGRYIAYLNDARLPNLRINRECARLVRDRTLPKRDRDFIRTSMSNASWLIDAVGQRRQTLLRVVRAVVEAQKDAFDLGLQAMKPLPMTQVAEELGIHVATVSRAVADKHLLTPRGVVPLRKFFTGGLSMEGGGEMSYDAVRAALAEVIAGEDRTSPLSDEAVVAALKGRGIEIARRTVAKYREQLGIPSARLRKAY